MTPALQHPTGPVPAMAKKTCLPQQGDHNLLVPAKRQQPAHPSKAFSLILFLQVPAETHQEQGSWTSQMVVRHLFQLQELQPSMSLASHTCVSFLLIFQAGLPLEHTIRPRTSQAPCLPWLSPPAFSFLVFRNATPSKLLVLARLQQPARLSKAPNFAHFALLQVRHSSRATPVPVQEMSFCPFFTQAPLRSSPQGYGPHRPACLLWLSPSPTWPKAPQSDVSFLAFCKICIRLCGLP